MKKKKTETVVNKIEYDQSSKKHIVVQVSEQEYLEQYQKDAPNPDDVDFIKRKTKKGERTKELAKDHFGIDQEDGSNINKRQKLFKRIVTLVFIVFVVGVLIFTAVNDFTPGQGREFPSLEELGAIFANNWYFLILAILSLWVGYFCKGLKLSLMCKSMTKKFHFRTCVGTGIIGTYYNNVTPLAVGGQPFEIYHLSKHGVHGGVAASLPIATFFLNQFAFVILGIISLIMFNANTLNMSPALLGAIDPAVVNILAIIGLCCCLFMPLLVVTFCMLPKIGAKLVHFVVKIGAKIHIIKNPKETTNKTIKTVVHNSHCLKKIATSPLLFISTFLISFIENFASASIAYFTLKLFGYPSNGITAPSILLEWAQVASICFILFASITFIPTPGNSGAADLSFFLLFKVGLAAGLAFPAMVVWRIASFYSTIIIGFVFATLKKKADLKQASLDKAVLKNEQMQFEPAKAPEKGEQQETEADNI